MECPTGLLMFTFGVIILAGVLGFGLIHFRTRKEDLAEENEILEEDNKQLKGKLGEIEERNFYSERGLDPIECEKHHYPGDCPLCGGV